MFCCTKAFLADFSVVAFFNRSFRRHGVGGLHSDPGAAGGRGEPGGGTAPLAHRAVGPLAAGLQ